MGMKSNEATTMTASETRAYVLANDLMRVRRGSLAPELRIVRDAMARIMWDEDEPTGVGSREAALRALSQVFPPPPPRPVSGAACQKCGGSGHIRAFAHIQGGACFGCAR